MSACNKCFEVNLLPCTPGTRMRATGRSVANESTPAQRCTRPFRQMPPQMRKISLNEFLDARRSLLRTEIAMLEKARSDQQIELNVVKDKFSQARAENARLAAEVDSFKARLASASADYADILEHRQGTIRTEEVRIRELQDKVDKLTADATGYQETISSLKVGRLWACARVWLLEGTEREERPLCFGRRRGAARVVTLCTTQARHTAGLQGRCVVSAQALFEHGASASVSARCRRQNRPHSHRQRARRRLPAPLFPSPSSAPPPPPLPSRRSPTPSRWKRSSS